jgi:hypothetical protein
MAAPLIDTEHAALIERLVSVNVGSRSRQNVPSAVRALAARLSPDRQRLTVFVARAQGEALLADIRATGAIAVVLSQPSTHLTLQVKGADAAEVPLVPGDREALARYADGMAADLGRIGWSEAFARALVGADPADVVAVAFTITAAFAQTPGPRAGEKLQARA